MLLGVPHCGFRGNGIKHIRHSEHGKCHARTGELMLPNHPGTVISSQICMEQLHMEEFRIKIAVIMCRRIF